ncbi:hypothetical protein PAECIP111891_00660 [Paenibacillus allorhizoplanae]|uniref:DUF4878 domain-containing protein n=1 Tax=Paenibacillus allorhizoplanae TaxID=2905648 RepID=A0ABN8G6B6_9BACL|nr:hypothetical protein [Paenibacillus allorhizoplanae]CAH1195358.1 hypothetical protein PAECIP111891_00660 [Paenibacillus allorhizoplanae]
MKWLLMLILLSCVSCMTGCASYVVHHDQTNDVSIQQQDDLKPIINKLFGTELEKDMASSVSTSKRILDYKIYDDIQSLKNEEDTYFIVTYDVLPASLEFIIAGGGERTEDGWIKNRVRYVTLQVVNGEYHIKSLSSGP